jgi:hypothetical protein
MESGVFGCDNLGISVSKAFLVMTPSSTRFRNVESRRGCTAANHFKSRMFSQEEHEENDTDFLPVISGGRNNVFKTLNSEILKFENGNFLIIINFIIPELSYE